MNWRRRRETVDHYCGAMLNPKMGLESSEVKLRWFNNKPIGGGGCFYYSPSVGLDKYEIPWVKVVDANDRGEPAVSYKWTSWVWEITIEVQDCRKITDHFRGIYRIYPNLIKENRRMPTCNRLDLQTLGSPPIVPKNLPDHWLTPSTEGEDEPRERENQNTDNYCRAWRSLC